MLSSCATVDKDDLASYVDQMHSDAAEAVLVATQTAAGKVPVSFAWIESGELEHHISELLDHLHGEMSAPEVTGEVQRAGQIGGQLEAELAFLHSKANDRQAAATVAPALEQQGEAAKSLFEELQ